MSKRLKISFVISAVLAYVLLAVLIQGQTPAARPNVPRMKDGKPNLTGLWQALGTAYWDIRDHSAQNGPFYQLGAIGAIPAGVGIVEGGDIPYRPEAAAKQRENFRNRLLLDPEVKCFMPGVPRGTYLPFPFQIIQSQGDIAIAYEYASANRVINMGKPKEVAVDTWMGTSNGRWEGDTLVVVVAGLNGMSWFDRSGNFMSENVRITERYTLANPDLMNYEATVEDNTIFTRPWKLSLPLYRRKERNAQLLEFKCVEFAEELLYGHLRKK
jgi:hypothetical protein